MSLSDVEYVGVSQMRLGAGSRVRVYVSVSSAYD